jgi:N-acetylmuramoyl-L-alanine amidase CwlA
MNNPLKYTDPSGYWWNPFKAVAKAWRSVWRGIKKYGRQIASPVTPWAISLLKPAFIGCNTLALNPAVNAPNIPWACEVDCLVVVSKADS